MGRYSAGLIAAVLALTGCKTTTDPKSPDRNAPGSVAGRTKGIDAKTPAWLDPSSRLPGANTKVPKGPAWSGDPRSPDFDSRAEARDGLSGKVVDGFNRPAKNVYLRIEIADAPRGSTPIGILADNNGYFTTRGLKAGTAYNVTAEATQEGKLLTGTVQTRVPNTAVTIMLREGLGLPPSEPKGSDRPVEGFPPPPTSTDADHIPAMGLAPGTPPPQPPRIPADGAFSPGAGATNRVPATIGSVPTPTPPKPVDPTPTPTLPGGIPEPDDLTAPAVRPRPENIADSAPRNPFAPPVASIPGPNVPKLPVPPPGPTPASPGDKQSRGPGANFRLIDSLERPWDFATNRSGSVVLVEFVTTSCPHCKPAIPVLKDIQSRYAADGLQVVAVLCDEVPQKQRAAAAGAYASDNKTNYSVYVEPGATPGALRDTLGVESYPRAVLLDANGSVLWNGHPGKKAELEAAVRRAFGK